MGKAVTVLAPQLPAVAIPLRFACSGRRPFCLVLCGSAGAMDMALGLRTMIIPDSSADTLYKYDAPKAPGCPPRREWSVHIQVGVVRHRSQEHAYMRDNGMTDGSPQSLML